MIVHVVAWSYDSGGGFDWYHKKEDADKGWYKELQNEKDETLAKEHWKAYRFAVDVPDRLTATQTTRAIDDELVHMCERATEHGDVYLMFYVGG